MISEDAYYTRPIALRNPIVFYEGHLPAFSVNTFLKGALKLPGVDPALEILFERGIDPHELPTENERGDWPSRAEVLAYGAEADRLIEHALLHEEIDRPGDARLHNAAAAVLILEHELMHQETLSYMWHRLPHDAKRPLAHEPSDFSDREGLASTVRRVDIPAGLATLGLDRNSPQFGWDNEFDSLTVDVPFFSIDVDSVTNGEYLEFVEAGGYHDSRFWSDSGFEWVKKLNVEHPVFWERRDDAWHWRGMLESLPLPHDWPVYVSQAEASAFSRWRGMRLPTEAEYHRAAFGTSEGTENRFPWGSEPAGPQHGNFDFLRFDPLPVGSFHEGTSAFGVRDLVGNGWEWTSTIFAPFPGFIPAPNYPVYSTDFFDGEHYVMKGASPVTGQELVRGSFRNWFRPNYPYVYAKFRCVSL